MLNFRIQMCTNGITIIAVASYIIFRNPGAKVTHLVCKPGKKFINNKKRSFYKINKNKMYGTD